MESPKQPGAETHGYLWLAQMQSKLIELAYDAIFICDMQSRLLSWNQGAESLYGYSKQQALGQVVHHLLQTQFPQPLADIYHHLKSTGRWEGELDHISRSGKLVRVAGSLSPMSRSTPLSFWRLIEILRNERSFNGNE